MHLGAAHDGATLDSHALPRVIAAVHAHGYRFVTLASVRAPQKVSSKPDQTGRIRPV